MCVRVRWEEGWEGKGVERGEEEVGHGLGSATAAIATATACSSMQHAGRQQKRSCQAVQTGTRNCWEGICIVRGRVQCRSALNAHLLT
ncbi:hypothetical protein M0804_007162 [Polistes exclamans]|nr:hypothetical protein M0804_007162 [Polistes exclamans]